MPLSLVGCAMGSLFNLVSARCRFFVATVGLLLLKRIHQIFHLCGHLIFGIVVGCIRFHRYYRISYKQWQYKMFHIRRTPSTNIIREKDRRGLQILIAQFYSGGKGFPHPCMAFLSGLTTDSTQRSRGRLCQDGRRCGMKINGEMAKCEMLIYKSACVMTSLWI